MLTVSYRIAALFGAAAVLVGWLSASLVVPPTLSSQERPPARRVVPTPPPLPPLALDAVHAPRVRPALARNPFAFGGGSEEAREHRREPVDAAPLPIAPATSLDSIAAAATPAMTWRLAGIASEADGGRTAILTGDGDVHLVRAGDVLGADTIEDVAATSVTLRLASGRTVVLPLP